jgi:dienelactone hydrolase
MRRRPAMALLTAAGLLLTSCGGQVSTGAPSPSPTRIPVIATTPKGAPQQVPRLAGLEVQVTTGGGGALSPAFSPDVTRYSITVESDIYHIGIVPSLPRGSTDSVTVNGVDATAGTPVGVEPPVGSSEASVVVASASGMRTTYTIAVGRDDIRPVADKFLKLSFTDPATKVTMGYRLFVPDGYDPKQSYPLVLFLHGAGERGTDNEKQLTADLGATVWATPEEQAKHAAFVLAPQSNGKPDSTTGWTSFMADDRFHPFDPQDQLVTAYHILQRVERDYSIDRKRVYLTGLSMGGFGAFALAIAHPNDFAALVSVCGGGDPARLAAIAKVPVWVFAAVFDPDVSVSRSVKTVQALRDAGASPRFTEYPTSAYFYPSPHFSWVPAYADSEMRDWMFRQSR